MFHLVAYLHYIPPGTEFKYINPIPDSQLRIEGYNVIVPEGLNHVIAVYAGGHYIERARLETPSLRRNMLLEIAPIFRGEYVGKWDHVHIYKEAPLTLDASEPMRFLAYHNDTNARGVLGLVWLADGPITPVVSEYFVARAICGNINRTGEWVNVSITFDQTLPAGRYQVIGARLQMASAIAFRLSFVGQSWRPGWLACRPFVPTTLAISKEETQQAILAYEEISSTVDYPIRGGRFGVWGEFPHDQPPTVDVLTNGYGTPVLYMDLVKIG